MSVGEFFSSIIQNGISFSALILLLVFIIGFVILTLKGKISVSLGSIKINTEMKDSLVNEAKVQMYQIMHLQEQYLTLACGALKVDIQKMLEDDNSSSQEIKELKTKSIIAEIEKMLFGCVVYNHITDSVEYISIHQKNIVNLVVKISKIKMANEIKEFFNNFVENTIREFVRIKKQYAQENGNDKK